MKYKINSLLFVWSLLFLNTAQAANITASLDRNPIYLDESFHLILQADDSVDDDPDFNALKKNFEILNQSQSTNMSYVNGTYSRQGVWNIELMAKKMGSLIIPSISFGSDRSNALGIQINDPATAKKSAKKNQDVFLQVEIDEDKAWVQSQIIVNVRLFRRISMNNLRSSEAETNDPDAIIKQLGNASTYEAFRDGVRYAVHEIRYAVFPQRSGTLIFKPIIFEGRVNSGRARSFMDQFMNAGERKRVRSNSVSIQVQAKPAAIKSSQWLPSKGITLSEQWSEDVSKLKNGEPVTRTITIKAYGLMAENLPELNMADIDQLKQYPDKAVLENNVTDQGITSIKQIKVALIPTRSGNFKLPAISIPWWNTATSKQELAVLPEKIIRAHGEAAVTPTITAAEKDQPTKQTSAPTVSSPLAASISHATYWPWLSLVLGLGWLITLFILFKKKPETASKIIQPDHTSLRTLEKAVYQQGKKNDCQQSKDALLAWAKLRWPESGMNNLMDISPAVTVELAAEIQALNAVLYSENTDQWQGEALLNTFKVFLQNKPHKNTNNQQPLESLYK